MEVDGREASPMKAVLQELEALQSSFHEALQLYASRMDEELGRVHQLVRQELDRGNPSQGKIRDLRDMLTLLRHVEIKKGKVRRKELRRFETVVEDLKGLVDRW